MNWRPDPSEYAPYFQGYVDLVPEDDILAALQKQASTTVDLLRPVDEERSRYR